MGFFSFIKDAGEKLFGSKQAEADAAAVADLDATNAETSPSAVEGLIPAYQILDISAGYTWKMLSLEASCNNVLNQMYFTRRAAAYPGPGIIPSDGRSFFVTLQVKI